MKSSIALLSDQQFPGNAEHEFAVLGSIVLKGPTEGFALIEGRLTAEDFLDESYRQIFRVLKASHEAGLPIHDPVVLLTQFQAAGLSKKQFGTSFISRLVNAVPHAAHLVYYADEVRKAARKRRIIEAATQLLRRGYDPTIDPEDAITTAESDLSRIAGDVPLAVATIGEAAAEVIAALEVPEVRGGGGVMTGLRELDDVVGPVMGGELEIVAGRPGQGKTAFAMMMSFHNAEHGRSVLFVSLEMQQREMAKRALCTFAGIDSRDLRERRLGGPAIAMLKECQQDMAGLPIHLWAPAEATMAQIRGLCRHFRVTRGLGMVVVDYLGLVKPSPDERRLPRHEQVRLISAGLKELAKELDVPVIALCQLNREADGEEPRLAHLRESGAIEQDADMVLFVYRPELHAKESRRSDGQHSAWIIVGKHRHGETGKVPVLWQPRETRFATFTEDF